MMDGKMKERSDNYHPPSKDQKDVLFQLDDLTKHFQNNSLLTRIWPNQENETVYAVNGVDLSIGKGETFGLAGESGCGKSTLARVALRLLEPTAGNIYFNGENITEYSDSQLRDFRSRTQMIFQDPFSSLNPRYNVRDTLVEPMKAHNIGDSKQERDERAAELVSRVGLGEDSLNRYPHEFSGGQRQRVAIARALAVEPELIIADEPVSSLDVSIQAQILNLFNDIRQELDLSILFITHDLSVIRQTCDRVGIMYLGQLIETGRTNDVFDDPKHPYTQSLLSSIPIPDPTADRDRILLEGDVSNSSKLPSGCVFNPRCPKVIPPKNWDGTQNQWRRIHQFKKQVESNGIQISSIREQLGEENSSVDDELVISEIYREYIKKEDVTDAETIQFPPSTKDDMYTAIGKLINDDHESAIAYLQKKYESVCETKAPREISFSETQTAHCHLHDHEIVK